MRYLFLALCVVLISTADLYAQYRRRASSGGCSGGSCAVAQTVVRVQSTVVQPPPVVIQPAPILIQERQTTVVRQASSYSAGSAYGRAGGGVLLRAPLVRLRIGGRY